MEDPDIARLRMLAELAKRVSWEPLIGLIADDLTDDPALKAVYAECIAAVPPDVLLALLDDLKRAV